MRRTLIRRAIVTLAALAWLLGASWHGSMGVQAALAAAGSEICTSHGVKTIPGGEPLVPVKSVPSECQLCAAFLAPGAAQAPTSHALAKPGPRAAFVLGSGTVLPSAHLVDLASRAPPIR